MAIVFSPFVLPPPIPPCTSVSTIPHSLSSCYSANNQYVLLSIAGFGLCVWCLQHNEIERVFRVFFWIFWSVAGRSRGVALSLHSSILTAKSCVFMQWLGCVFGGKSEP